MIRFGYAIEKPKAIRRIHASEDHNARQKSACGGATLLTLARDLDPDGGIARRGDRGGAGRAVIGAARAAACWPSEWPAATGRPSCAVLHAARRARWATCARATDAFRAPELSHAAGVLQHAVCPLPERDANHPQHRKRPFIPGGCVY